MIVEILLLILIGVLSLGSYKIINRLILVDSKINELYEIRHQVRELHHLQVLLLRYTEETRHQVRELDRHIDELREDQQRINRDQRRTYDLVENTNHSVQQLQHTLENINFGWAHDLQRRFAQLESFVTERLNHVDVFFENINSRLDYFNNRLHHINAQIQQSFSNKKTRLRKKLNLSYMFSRRKRLD